MSAPAGIMLRVALIVNRSDLFPVGTSVGAYPAGASREGATPAGTALESATVSAGGQLVFTGLSPGTKVALYASVGGVARMLRTEAPAQAVEGRPYRPLKERIFRRRRDLGVA